MHWLIMDVTSNWMAKSDSECSKWLKAAHEVNTIYNSMYVWQWHRNSKQIKWRRIITLRTFLQLRLNDLDPRKNEWAWEFERGKWSCNNNELSQTGNLQVWVWVPRYQVLLFCITGIVMMVPSNNLQMNTNKYMIKPIPVCHGTVLSRFATLVNQTGCLHLLPCTKVGNKLMQNANLHGYGHSLDSEW